jgi:hypothetical protein
LYRKAWGIAIDPCSRLPEAVQAQGEGFQTRAPQVAHLKVAGKGGKMRYIPLHPAASGLIIDYLEQAGYGEDNTWDPLQAHP